VGDTNGWVDVFGLSRLPVSKGQWSGEVGNSDWWSTHEGVNSVTKGEGIPFKDCHAVFDKWSYGSIQVDGVTDLNKDFRLVYKKMKADYGLKSQKEAKALLKEWGLTPHHHQDMKTIQLIPSILHNNVPHEGGASKLRKHNH
jgi:hypothetical protein